MGISRILIIQAHPDAAHAHFCHAIADRYREAATGAGHLVNTIDLGKMEIPILRSKSEWESSDVPEFVRAGQEAIDRADHLVFVYPLWMGTMPALLKAWIEQIFRPQFAFNLTDDGLGWNAKLGGQSARIIVTMGMPAAIYRWFYVSHSLRSFERNILKFSGIKPVRTSVIGLVETKNVKRRQKWLDRIGKLGSCAR